MHVTVRPQDAVPKVTSEQLLCAASAAIKWQVSGLSRSFRSRSKTKCTYLSDQRVKGRKAPEALECASVSPLMAMKLETSVSDYSPIASLVHKRKPIAKRKDRRGGCQ